MKPRNRLSDVWLFLLTVVLVVAFAASVLLNIGPLFLQYGVATAFLVWLFPQFEAAPESFAQLPSLVASAAALVALSTFRRERAKWEHEREKHQSEFFFRQAAAGLDEALGLLRDQNNDRVIWVRAARSLLQAQELSKAIHLPEFQSAYRLHEQRVRNDLYLALTVRDAETGQRNALPPQFFYGVRDWGSRRPLDEVAKEVSLPSEAYEVTLDNLPPQPHLQPLSRKTVVAIYDFLNYPDNYDDPLQRVAEWTDDWTESHGEKMGAARYIAHSNKKMAIGGQLYDRETSKPLPPEQGK